MILLCSCRPLSYRPVQISGAQTVRVRKGFRRSTLIIRLGSRAFGPRLGRPRAPHSSLGRPSNPPSSVGSLTVSKESGPSRVVRKYPLTRSMGSLGARNCPQERVEERVRTAIILSQSISMPKERVRRLASANMRTCCTGQHPKVSSWPFLTPCFAPTTRLVNYLIQQRPYKDLMNRFTYKQGIVRMMVLMPRLSGSIGRMGMEITKAHLQGTTF